MLHRNFVLSRRAYRVPLELALCYKTPPALTGGLTQEAGCLHLAKLGSLFKRLERQELIPGYLNGIEATYTPPKGYFVAEENPEEFAKYEAEFPYKEKLVLPGQLG